MFNIRELIFATQVPSLIQNDVPTELQLQPSSSIDAKSPDPLLPIFTPYDLKKFQFNFLTESQLVQCEKLFLERNFTEPNPIYQAWLQLKLASLPTEGEALQAVLQKHAPKNLPKWKKAVIHKVPYGAARFNPISQDWVKILEDRDSNASAPPPAKTIKTTAAPMPTTAPGITAAIQPQEDVAAIGPEQPYKATLKSFECEQCGRFYSTKASLRTHKYQHKKSQQQNALQHQGRDDEQTNDAQEQERSNEVQLMANQGQDLELDEMGSPQAGKSTD